MSLNWRGKEAKAKMLAASIYGINKVMSLSVNYAIANHWGWQNISGAAEGSIRIIDFAKHDGKQIVGRWGSTGIGYVIWLELNHGSFLRGAAETLYPTLARHIKKEFAA